MAGWLGDPMTSNYGTTIPNFNLYAVVQLKAEQQSSAEFETGLFLPFPPPFCTFAQSTERSSEAAVEKHERYCVVGSYHSVMGWYLLLVFIAETELCAGRVLF